MRWSSVWYACGDMHQAQVRLMVARYSSYTNVHTHDRFHIPRAPTAPTLAPAAGAGPGGLEGELAGPDPPGSGDAGVRLANPGRIKPDQAGSSRISTGSTR